MVAQKSIRQNYHEDCEAALNKHINVELHLSYVYLSMSYYFDRDDQALAGFCKFFLDASESEKENADKLMKYQNKRGGRLVYQNIPAPSAQQWGAVTDTVKNSLDIQKQLHQSTLELKKLASDKEDPHMEEFLDEFLEGQINTIQNHGHILTKLKRVGNGVGLHVYDKEFQ